MKQLSRGQRTSCVIPALILNHNNAVPTHSCSFITAVRQDSVVPHSNRAFRHSLRRFQTRPASEVLIDDRSASMDGLDFWASLGSIPNEAASWIWFRAGVGLTIHMAPGRFNAMKILEGAGKMLVGKGGGWDGKSWSQGPKFQVVKSPSRQIVRLPNRHCSGLFGDQVVDTLAPNR